LNNDIAVEFVRPGLEALLKSYLKIMDDIDFDQLVHALQSIVSVFEQDIAPYAVGLCQKLGDTYIRLINSQGPEDEEDQETQLTATGLIVAIRRVLTSIANND
jgi:hypothetical protein